MSVLGVHPIDRDEGVSEATDFSLVLGGPLYQLFRRARLSGDTLELLHRRMIGIVAFAWLPLLVLTAIQRFGNAAPLVIPFVRDCDAQARFLVALPLLIAAELTVHLRTRSVALNFVRRDIIAAEDLPALNAALATAKRVRNSIPLEVLLLVLAFTVGHWNWRNQVVLTHSTWYASVDDGSWHLTPAGYWYAYVSVPTFQ